MQFARTICCIAVLGSAITSSLQAQRGPGVQRGTTTHAPHAAQTITPNLGGQAYPIRRDIPAPVGLNPPAASYTGISPGAFRSTNGYYGRGQQFFPGVVAAPFYLPPYFDASISTIPSFNETIPPVDPNAQAMAESQDALAQQIQNLTREIQNMKNSAQTQQAMPVPMPPAVSNNPAERRPPTPPVTLILRDGQQITVDSYAVMNGTFWNFSKHPAQKIPVANIDLPASAKATESNGGEFPSIGSAQ